MKKELWIVFIFFVHVGISIYEKGFVITNTFGTESIMSIAIFIAYFGVKGK